jgi:hypothetical protein
MLRLLNFFPGKTTAASIFRIAGLTLRIVLAIWRREHPKTVSDVLTGLRAHFPLTFHVLGFHFFFTQSNFDMVAI